MKAGHHASVAQAHAGSVGVEDANDLGVDPMVAVVSHGDGLGEALGLIINAARADRVDVAPVILLLRMDQGIAVAFGSGREEKGRPFGLGQAQRVMGAEGADFQGRDRQLEIIDRAGGRREMKDVIKFLLRDIDVIGDVMLDEEVIRVAGEVRDVRGVAGDQVIDRDDAVPLAQEPVGQMRPEKARATGDN